MLNTFPAFAGEEDDGNLPKSEISLSERIDVQLGRAQETKGLGLDAFKRQIITNLIQSLVKPMETIDFNRPQVQNNMHSGMQTAKVL